MSGIDILSEDTSQSLIQWNDLYANRLQTKCTEKPLFSFISVDDFQKLSLFRHITRTNKRRPSNRGHTLPDLQE